MKFNRTPIGPDLDAEICRKVFGLSDKELVSLVARRRLPRYSTDYGQGAKVHEHFFRMRRCGENVDQVSWYVAALEE